MWVHRIIESQGWKGPTRSSSPAVLPFPLLPQATKPYLVAPHPDASSTLPGTVTPPPPWAAIPVPDHSLREKVFPYVQFKPPLVQLVAISLGPVCCLREEAKSLLITTSLQEIVDCNEVSSEPPLFQTKPIPAPSAAPHKTCAPDPSPVSLPFSGHVPGPQCLSCSEGPKTEYSTRACSTACHTIPVVQNFMSCWTGYSCWRWVLLTLVFRHTRLQERAGSRYDTTCENLSQSLCGSDRQTWPLY